MREHRARAYRGFLAMDVSDVSMRSGNHPAVSSTSWRGSLVPHHSTYTLGRLTACTPTLDQTPGHASPEGTASTGEFLPSPRTTSANRAIPPPPSPANEIPRALQVERTRLSDPPAVTKALPSCKNRARLIPPEPCARSSWNSAGYGWSLGHGCRYNLTRL